jgi:bacterial/archaeal transporter family protein
MNWLLWSLLSAIFAAATAVLAKIGVSHVDPNLATAIRTTAILVLAWGIAIGLGSHQGLAALDRRSVGMLVASGVATGLSWLCYFRALATGPASKVAPVDKLSVVFVILLSSLVLGERLTPGKLFGGALIVAGAVVLTLSH